MTRGRAWTVIAVGLVAFWLTVGWVVGVIR
jgi:hypothetical protein